MNDSFLQYLPNILPMIVIAPTKLTMDELKDQSEFNRNVYSYSLDTFD